MATPSTWALVANPVRARILRALEAGPDGGQPPGELVERCRSLHLLTELSRPPSGDAPEGAGAEAVAADLRAFARDLARLLDTHRLAGDFARLAVFAPHGMLHHLRAQMSSGLRACVVLERASDLTARDPAELRRVVGHAVAAADDPAAPRDREVGP
jgi:hypothetical protein